MKWNSEAETIKAHRDFPVKQLFSNTLALPRLMKLYTEIPANSKVLDVGCNSGEFGGFVAYAKKCDVTGIDVSKEVVGKVSEQGINFINCPIEDNPFKDEQFNVVVASETLEHLFDIKKALKEIHRVLILGGLFIGTVPHPDISPEDEPWHCNKFTAESLKNLLLEFFVNVSIDTIPGIEGFLGKGQHLFFRAVKR